MRVPALLKTITVAVTTHTFAESKTKIFDNILQQTMTDSIPREIPGDFRLFYIFSSL